MPKKTRPEKLCYVIMPFSDTERCTEGQWSTIFTGLIKPAVEEAGLGCASRRSKATTGNMIKKIVGDLYGANVVIADLTDRRANVFYELGVRHTLRNRTILIAQRRADIPSDLDGYASHEYDWNTEAGQQEFRANIRGTLQHLDDDPDRPDSPVSDFIRSLSILQFRRDENSLRLRALLEEADRICWSIGTQLELSDPDDEYVLGLRQPSPALDFLIAAQYVHEQRFAHFAHNLRGMLEMIADPHVPPSNAKHVFEGANAFRRNVARVLAAYEAGDSLDEVDIEPFPSHQ